MITELEIKNFKGIQNLKLSNFERFNVFIGKNDSSKSTILESIFTFKAILHNQVTNFAKVIRMKTRPQHARELWHDYSTSTDPTISLVFDGIKLDSRFHSTFDFNSVDIDLNIKTMGHCFVKLNSTLTKLIDAKDQIASTPPSQKLKSDFENMLFFDDISRRDTRTWEEKIISKNIPAVDIYSESNQGNSVVDYIGAEKRLLLGTGSSGRFIDSYGEGHKSGMALLSLVTGIKNSIILVEEIETNQHPESLRNLIKEFIKICETNKNQAFISTHSPEVLQLFSTSSSTKLFHLQNLKQKNVSANEINSTDIVMMRDIGWNLGNLLSFEKFVLVEGELDKVIFENIFYKIKKYWPEELGINFVMCGGYTNQKELLKALAFPDKKIFVQRDYDDKSESDVKNEIFDGFKELTDQGFSENEDSDTIKLEKNGITKLLSKKNIILTGMPGKINNIQKFATDDYILDILHSEPSILSEISGANTTIPTSQFVNSKQILNNVLGNYDGTKAIEIIKKMDSANIPTDLKNFVDIIEKQ